MQSQDDWPADATIPQTLNPLEDQEAREIAEAEAEFDERVREDVEGLLFLGRLEEEFTWAGHTFLIRTITIGETLEIGVLSSAYHGTRSEGRAYQTAVVAASLVSVDGAPVAIPLTNAPKDTELRSKFNYILRSWFPPTVDEIYQRFLILEVRAEAAVNHLKKASR